MSTAGTPATDRPATGFEGLAVAFARVLRHTGLPVGTDAVVTYTRALAAVGVDRRGPVYWAGRAVLVHRPEDVPAYDAAFDGFWLGRAPEPPTGATSPAPGDEVPLPASLGADTDPGDLGADRADDGDRDPVVPLRFSPAEVLRHKDLARCTPAELAEAERLMAAIRLGGERRRTRRRRPARGGDRLDVRRTLRQSLRTGGEPLQRRWLARTERPRRVVLLCDVSASMAPYARALLRFAQVAVAGRRRVEAFTIATRLTRVTRSLTARDPEGALAAASATVADWAGGTRLGEALAVFNDRWGVPGLARGAVVVILSDGWDRGDPALLGAEMARLARVAHRVVWANPLKATPGYAPLARGMAAALPHVDELVEGHSVASLADLARLVSGERTSAGHASASLAGRWRPSGPAPRSGGGRG